MFVLLKKSNFLHLLCSRHFQVLVHDPFDQQTFRKLKLVVFIDSESAYVRHSLSDYYSEQQKLAPSPTGSLASLFAAYAGHVITSKCSRRGCQYATFGFEAPGGVGGIPYNGIYGEAPPKRGTLSRLEVYKRAGISLVEV